jgi:hypothetical protein
MTGREICHARKPHAACKQFAARLADSVLKHCGVQSGALPEQLLEKIREPVDQDLSRQAEQMPYIYRQWSVIS